MRPTQDYLAARGAAAWVAREDRALLRMYGRDPLRILQGIVTNDVAGAPLDRAVYAALRRKTGDLRREKIAGQPRGGVASKVEQTVA